MTLLPLLALLAQDTSVSHEFVFTPPKVVKAVSVAGTFNDWNKSANPMVQNGSAWTTKIRIKPGKHLYKFVMDGEEWVTDPKAVRNESDGEGHTNSVLLIKPRGFELPAVRGDGKITESALVHSGKVPDLNYDRGMLTVRLVTRSGDVQSAFLQTGGKRLAMKELSGSDEFYTTYEAEVAWNRMAPFRYAFAVKDKATEINFGREGARNRDLFTIDPKTFMPIEVPSWVEKTVFYQIFPDRFENGSKKNDPADTQNWKTGVPTYSNWFGGDAAGISQRIPYLKSLGVNGIYINPIMVGNSNHRYDPCDFYKIDPPFGTNAEFIQLTKDLNKVGIKTVLDQILDHVGIKFPQFLDLLKNQEKSKYKDWFFVKSYPVEVRPNPPYEGWWGTEYMPKVNMNNPEVREYLLKSIAFWMKEAELAGWRMDVANEVPMEFWREFRKFVKQIDPKAYIVGEVWYNAAPWLGGDQWDASMNYPFRDQVVKYVAQGTTSATQFANGLMQVYRFTAPQVARNQLNLLSSHDTERFIHLANGDRRLQMLGATVQMTWAGAPSIYYGEELGMPGGKDPDNRRPMDWDQVKPNNEVLNHYKKLIGLRTASRVLASGDPKILLADDAKKVVAYARVYNGEAVITAINRSEAAQTVSIPVGNLPAEVVAKLTKPMQDVLGTQKVSLSPTRMLNLTVAPFGSAIVGTSGSGIGQKQSIASKSGGDRS